MRRIPARRVAFIVLGALAFSAQVHAYEQSDAFPAHQWITQQAVLFYRSQFGSCEVDSFLGAVQTYPTGDNNRFIEGAYDEDVDRENPFNQANPFFNHFWNYFPSFSRPWNRGLFNTNDSAANRSIKYFTGGNGLTAVYDTLWGQAQGAAQDRGIVWTYRNDTGDNARKGRAYYWLGEVAHLLQDCTLPCHVLNDAHPTVTDQDPTHDWIDGRAFATGILGGAAFDDATARRWENWRYDVATKGVGRPGGTQAMVTSALRSFAQLRDMTLASEWADSIPAAAQAQSRPLYHLFLETAGRADDFDSRDRNGQVDAGARRNNGGSYANWTRAELNEVADVIAPRAMRATAELLRYFYALVDTTPATVTIPGLSADETAQTLISGSAMIVIATGSDPTSGVDLDGYRFTLDLRGCCGWTPVAASGPDLPDTGFTGLAPGLYRVRASVENGAGATSDSPYAYFERVTPVGVAVDGLEAIWGPGAITVVWQLPRATLGQWSGVRVERAESKDGPYAECTTVPLVPAPVMSYTDTRVAATRSASLWYRLVLERAESPPQITAPVVVVSGGPGAGTSGLVAVRAGADGHSAVITYRIAGAHHPVQLDVYNVSGERVRQIEHTPHDPGTYVRTWDGADDSGVRVARGVYFVRWAAGAARQSRKVVLRVD